MSNPSEHLGLLLIDFQDVFLNEIPDRERLLKRSTFALKVAELLGVSVAVTEQIPEKLGTTYRSLKRILGRQHARFRQERFFRIRRRRPASMDRK